MAKSKITLWEKTKRVVAHLFQVETRLEIQERIEAQKQQELKLAHELHIEALMVQYADGIAAYQEQREAQQKLEKEMDEIREQMEILKKEQEETIRMYKDNERLKREILWNKRKDIAEEVIVLEEVSVAEETQE